MKVFIVYAHNEDKSFNGALLKKSHEVLESKGHEIKVSDLYKMNFNPISGRHNFTTVKDPDYFKSG